ncbi:MAG: hypothetical protein BIFFINMI_03985 [Phycisphaerae bacterium]|nr:hypothetical protein [Phycisphaerae bacterium]
MSDPHQADSRGPAPAASAPPAAATPVRRKRRRRWLRVLAVFLLLLVALVAFAPIIASTPPVRSLILSRVNREIRGTIQLDDLSLGWFSDQRLRGVRLLDADGIEIVSVDRVSVPVGLASVLFGRRDLGQIVVQSLHGRLARDAQGQFRIVAAFKSTAAASKQPHEPKASKQPALPPWKFSLAVNDLRITVAPPPAAPDAGEVQVAGALSVSARDGLGAPVSHKLDLTVAAAGSTGTLQAEGQATPWRDGRWGDPAALAAGEKASFDMPAEVVRWAAATLDLPLDYQSGRLTGELTDARLNGPGDLAATLDLRGNQVAFVRTDSGDGYRFARLALHVTAGSPKPGQADPLPAAAPAWARRFPLILSAQLKELDATVSGPRFEQPLRLVGSAELSVPRGLGGAAESDADLTVEAGAERGRVQATAAVQPAWRGQGEFDLPRLRVQRSKLTLTGVPIDLLVLLGKAKAVPAELRGGRLDGTAAVTAPAGLEGDIVPSVDLMIAAGGTTQKAALDGAIRLPWRADGTLDAERFADELIARGVKVTATDLRLVLTNFFLGDAPDGAGLKLTAGVLNGSIALDVHGLGDVSGKVAGLKVTGAGLDLPTGDAVRDLRAESDVQFAIKDGLLTVAGLEGGRNVLRAMVGGKELVSLNASGQAPVGQLKELVGGLLSREMPEVPSFSLDLNDSVIDEALLVRTLPGLARSIGLREGAAVTGGTLRLVQLRLAGDGRTRALDCQVAQSRVEGTFGGQPVAVRPVTLALHVRFDGRNWSLPSDNPDRAGLKLDAAWAKNFAVSGDLDDLQAGSADNRITLDLGVLHDELAQFIDPGERRMGGQVALTVSSRRVRPEGSLEDQLRIQAQAAFADLRIAGFGPATWSDPRPSIDMTVYYPYATRDLRLQRPIVATLKLQNSRLADQLSAEAGYGEPAPLPVGSSESAAPPTLTFTARATNVDLAQVQALLGKSLGLPPGTALAGRANLLARGDYVGDTLRLAAPAGDPERFGLSASVAGLVYAQPAEAPGGQPRRIEMKQASMAVPGLSADLAAMTADASRLTVAGDGVKTLELTGVHVGDLRAAQKTFAVAHADVVVELAEVTPLPVLLGATQAAGHVELHGDLRCDADGVLRSDRLKPDLQNVLIVMPAAQLSEAPRRIEAGRLTADVQGLALDPAHRGAELTQLALTGDGIERCDLKGLKASGLGGDRPTVALDSGDVSADLGRVPLLRGLLRAEDLAGRLTLKTGARTDAAGRITGMAHALLTGGRLILPPAAVGGQPRRYEAAQLAVDAPGFTFDPAKWELSVPVADVSGDGIQTCRLTGARVWNMRPGPMSFEGHAVVKADLARLPLLPGMLAPTRLAGVADLDADAKSADGGVLLLTANRGDVFGLKVTRPASEDEPGRTIESAQVSFANAQPIRYDPQAGRLEVAQLGVTAKDASGAATAAQLGVSDLSVTGLSGGGSSAVTVKSLTARSPAEWLFAILNGLAARQDSNSYGGTIELSASITRDAAGRVAWAPTVTWTNLNVTPRAKSENAPLADPRLQISLRVIQDDARDSWTFERLAVSSVNKLADGEAAGSLTDLKQTKLLQLKGKMAIRGSALQTFLGDQWPEGLTFTEGRPSEFALNWPMYLKFDAAAMLKVAPDWARIDYKGLVVGSPSPPIELTLNHGKMVIPLTSAPANNGKLNWEGHVDLQSVRRFTVPALTDPKTGVRHPAQTLTEPIAWLTITPKAAPPEFAPLPGPVGVPAPPPEPPTLALVQDVEINQEMSRNFLQSIPVLWRAREAHGVMTLKLDKADMPLDGRALKARDLDSVLSGRLSMRHLVIRGGLMGSLDTALGTKVEGEEGTLLEQPLLMKSGRFYVQSLTMDFGGRKLTFDGWVGLDDTMEMSVTLLVTADLLQKYAGTWKFIGKDLITYLGDAPITVPLKGTPGDPQLDTSKLPAEIGKLAARAGAKYLEEQARKRMGNPGQQQPGQQDQPGEKKPDDKTKAIQDALEAILKGLDKDKNKKP